MLPQGDDRLISFSVHTQNKYDHKEEKKKKARLEDYAFSLNFLAFPGCSCTISVCFLWR